MSKYSYVITATFLVLYTILFTLKGEWSGDFWEHCAVVKELSKNLVNPKNPIIVSDIPHAFFSPYSVLVSIFSKITNLSAIKSLEFFSLFNIFLFLIGFYLFCKSLFQKNYNLIASISLICTLFLWGHDPYRWSGFYHFPALQYVLPYPSTFSMAIVFIILSLILKDVKQERVSYFILTVPLIAIVTITHPTTAITLYIAIVVIYFIYNNYSFKKCIVNSSLLLIPGLLLCLVWPYFNFIDLLSGNNKDFHGDSLELYRKIVKRVWPSLIIVPYLFFYKKDRIVLFLLITIVILLIVYLGGYFSGIYGVSRVIANIMMFSHFLIAYIIFNLIINRSFKTHAYLGLIITTFAAALLFNSGNYYNTVLNLFKAKDVQYYQKLSFLETKVKNDDLIVSHGITNWMIPSFGGKVLSSGHPLYWVKDLAERRQNLDTLFAKSTTDSIRIHVIKKYKPDYILLNYKEMNLEPSTFQWFKSRGTSVYKRDMLELIKLTHQYDL